MTTTPENRSSDNKPWESVTDVDGSPPENPRSRISGGDIYRWGSHRPWPSFCPGRSAVGVAVEAVADVGVDVGVVGSAVAVEQAGGLEGVFGVSVVWIQVSYSRLASREWVAASSTLVSSG